MYSRLLRTFRCHFEIAALSSFFTEDQHYKLKCRTCSRNSRTLTKCCTIDNLILAQDSIYIQLQLAAIDFKK